MDGGAHFGPLVMKGAVVMSMMEKDLNEMESGLTVIQRVAICFAAGVIGALAVDLFSSC